MAAMSIYRSEDLSHADVTTWLYDEATGLLVFKVYADGKGRPMTTHPMADSPAAPGLAASRPTTPTMGKDD